MTSPMETLYSILEIENWFSQYNLHRNTNSERCITFVNPTGDIRSQRSRIAEIRTKYAKQFQHEILTLINYHSTVSEALCLHRIMSITTNWPPLHTRQEIDYTLRNMNRLTREQRKRLNWIMTNNIQ